MGGTRLLDGAVVEVVTLRTILTRFPRPKIAALVDQLRWRR